MKFEILSSLVFSGVNLRGLCVSAAFYF